MNEQNYTEQRISLIQKLRVKENFDVICREMKIGGRDAAFFFIDGFVKDEILEKMMEFLMNLAESNVKDISFTEKDQRANAFAKRFITYVETDVVTDEEKMMTAVLSGTVCLISALFPGAILIDARTYPVRSVSEPDDDRVLRGSRDGFVETVVFNTALIRRRIRDPQLTMDILQIGKKSKTDVVLCYLADTVDQKFLQKVKRKINEISIGSLTMGQESLAECLTHPHHWNPFPKIRYTERPDVAAATILEGSIAVITDNSPSVMLLPTSIFDFVQDANDFYFPPIIGSYLRFVRMAVFLATLLLTPVWLLLLQNPTWIPEWLSFIKVEGDVGLPIVVQLLIIEFVVDGLKLASLNTPTVLSSSFSVVGALILGDFAVQAKWFVPEVVLYMAFVTIANFSQPSFELGYAFKLFRMLLVITTAIWNLWGFLGGLALIALIMICTRTISGNSYLYPLIPFNWRALRGILVRRSINQDNS